MGYGYANNNHSGAPFAAYAPFAGPSNTSFGGPPTPDGHYNGARPMEPNSYNMQNLGPSQYGGAGGSSSPPSSYPSTLPPQNVPYGQPHGQSGPSYGQGPPAGFDGQAPLSSGHGELQGSEYGYLNYFNGERTPGSVSSHLTSPLPPGAAPPTGLPPPNPIAIPPGSSQVITAPPPTAYQTKRSSNAPSYATSPSIYSVAGAADGDRFFPAGDEGNTPPTPLVPPEYSGGPGVVVRDRKSSAHYAGDSGYHGSSAHGHATSPSYPQGSTSGLHYRTMSADDDDVDPFEHDDYPRPGGYFTGSPGYAGYAPTDRADSPPVVEVDQRLDPDAIMASRAKGDKSPGKRMSMGLGGGRPNAYAASSGSELSLQSLRDNEDYSRRVLQVCYTPPYFM